MSLQQLRVLTVSESKSNKYLWFGKALRAQSNTDNEVDGVRFSFSTADAIGAILGSKFTLSSNFMLVGGYDVVYVLLRHEDGTILTTKYTKEENRVIHSKPAPEEARHAISIVLKDIEQ